MSKEAHPARPPSPWAVIACEYGSEMKHLYTLSEWDGIEFHPDEEAARAAARRIIEDDPKRKVALMKVEEIMAAKWEVQTVVTAAA